MSLAFAGAPTSPTVTADINSRFIQEEGRLNEFLGQVALKDQIWTGDLVRYGEWPAMMGDNITISRAERALPSFLSDNLAGFYGVFNTMGGVNSNDVTVSQTIDNGAFEGISGFSVPPGTVTGGTMSILPPVTVLGDTPITTSVLSLWQTALQSNPININQLRPSYQGEKQVAALYENMQNAVKMLHATWNSMEYAKVSDHKIIACAELFDGFDLSTRDSYGFTSFPNVTPTCFPTQWVLESVYNRAIGAGIGDYVKYREDNRPLLTLFTSQETIRDYKRLAGIRDDIHFAGRAPELLEPLGITRSYHNFYFIYDQYTPRYNVVVGTLTRVSPYKTVASPNGRGNMIVHNPAYDTATYEDTIVYLPEVYTQLRITKDVPVGEGASFGPQDYTGTWRWLNIPHPTLNPDSSIGFWRSTIALATEPNRTQFGFVLRHLTAYAAGQIAAAGGNPYGFSLNSSGQLNPGPQVGQFVGS